MTDKPVLNTIQELSDAMRDDDEIIGYVRASPDPAKVIVGVLLQRYDLSPALRADLVKSELHAIAADFSAPWASDYRVGGDRLPDFVRLADGHQIEIEHATVNQWFDPANRGWPNFAGIAGQLLGRAGGDHDTKIIDLIDP